MVSSRGWEASPVLLLLLPGQSPQHSWVPIPVSWRKPAQRGYAVDLKSQLGCQGFKFCFISFSLF